MATYAVEAHEVERGLEVRDRPEPRNDRRTGASPAVEDRSERGRGPSARPAVRSL